LGYPDQQWVQKKSYGAPIINQHYTAVVGVRTMTLSIYKVEVQQELQALRDRLEILERQAYQENLALSGLLERLESVVVNARQFWYQKTTLLNWMIITLALIVLDRLLSHFPAIVEIVTKLL
jgi:hypothetical protein